jgi:hypothetical protein
MIIYTLHITKSTYIPSTNYMKHTHVEEDDANRPHKEIEDAFAKFNRTTYINWTFNAILI